MPMIIHFFISSARINASPGAPSSTEIGCWVVLMDRPPESIQSRDEVVNYYVSTLQRAIGNDKDARSCIYDSFYDTHFGFCCNIDEETSIVLAGLPGVLSVTPESEKSSVYKNYNTFNHEGNSMSVSSKRSTLLFPEGWENWLVRIDERLAGVFSKAQAVDYYVDMLTKVLGNKKDAQMCIYHVSWESNFGFSCVLDEQSAQEIATVPGVLSIQLDEHFGSENKDYGGSKLSSDARNFTQTAEMSKTKLFITGLSFYTSEKTLHAAFEPFGELVEVKVIMDKISKRSKGYAFVEYATEEAATTALQEMNGKIINGWMIVVDRAKSKPKSSRTHPRSTSVRDRKLV